MNGRRFDVLLGIVAIVALCAYALLRGEQADTPVSAFSSYDYGANGYRALADVLARSGVPVREFGRPADELRHDVGTLVVSSNAPESGRIASARALAPHDVAALARWVRGGGHLVMLDTDFDAIAKAALGVPSSVFVKERTRAFAVPRRTQPHAPAVSGDFFEAFGFATKRGARPLLATERGVVALTYALGSGSVVAITDPTVFSNARLAKDDNAAFAYGVLAGHGTVAFDEYLHGYGQDRTVWQALPAPIHVALVLLLSIVVLAAIGANLRPEPPVALDPPDERDSSAYIAAMAVLLRRARAARSAAAIFANDALRRARRRFSLRDDADISAIALRIARNDVRQGLADLDRLCTRASIDDAALARAAATYQFLRKELG